MDIDVRRAFFIFVALFIVTCGREPHVTKQHPRIDCGPLRAVDRRAIAHAGSGAVDCGCGEMLDRFEQTRRVQDCMASMFLEHKPFRARFQAQGIDAPVVHSVASDQSGAIVTFRDDSPASRPCEQPSVQTVEGRRVLLCSGNIAAGW